MHLRRALVDDRRAGVSERSLDPVLGAVAVRAVHLDREVRRAERRLGCVPLRERRLARVPDALVLHPRGLEDEELRRLVAEDHLGEHVLDELVLPDRLTERLALACVLDRPLEARPDDAARSCSDGEAALVEAVHRDLEPLALLADQVLGGHLDVLEEELAGRAGPDAELVLRLGRREAGRALLQDERRDALVLRGRVRLREDERVVGDGGVGDPVLLAVQDVDVALEAGGRLHRGHVRSGRGLGEAEAGDLLAARLRDEPALLLLLARVAEERERVQTDVDRDQRAEGRLAALDLLARERLRDEVEPGPAVLLRDRDPEDAELGHALDRAHVEVVRDVVLDRVREDPILDELPDRVLEQPLLVGELEVHVGSLSRARGRPRGCVPLRERSLRGRARSRSAFRP